MRSALVLVCCLPALFAQQGGTLSLVSGNGQVVQEQFRTTVPMTVLARDSSGRPVAGVPVNWAIASGQGTLNGTTTSTDPNGQAMTFFVATSLQPGTSYLPATVTATSALGSVSFVVTTTASRTPAGTIAAPPLVEILTPSLENRLIRGRAGETLPGGIRVRVIAQGGVQIGQPVPNVGIRIVPPETGTTGPTATCAGPGGTALSDANGIASCDLVLGPVAGTVPINANVGEYTNTPGFTLQVDPGQNCTYRLSSTSQLFASNGGTGAVDVTTQSGCAWTVLSTANWITITRGSSGTGNGSVTYAVATNTGGSRTGTLTIAGQTFTVTQTQAGQAAFEITTTTLPGATTGSPYSITLAANGGTPPYRWSISGALPPGLTLNEQTGTIGGTPTSAGSFSLVVTATDASNNTASRNLSLTILNTGAGPTITTTSLPAGSVGTNYQQAISVTGGCATPFLPKPSVSVSSGSLPPGLQVQQQSDGGYAISGTPTQSGTFNFVLKANDACGVSSTRSLSITIGGGGSTAPQLLTSPPSLTFNVAQGSATIPTQTISIESSAGSLQFSASATSEQGSWLMISGANTGTTPGRVTVAPVNVAGLAAGTYRGTITISSTQTAPVTVPVTLNITSSPLLSLSSTQVVFDLRAGDVGNQSVLVNSSTPGVRVTITRSDASWLSLTPTSVDTPGTVNLTANTSNLAPGTYNGSVTFTGPGNPLTIPVTLLVRARPTLRATPEAVVLRYRLNASGPPSAEEVQLATSGEDVGFTTTAVTTTGNWLVVSPSRGTAPGRITISANPSGLVPGTYSGSVSILSLDPAVPPVTVPVTLILQTAGPQVQAVTNAASFSTGPIAPGEYITLFGSGLGPSSLVSGTTTNARLDVEAGGTRVLIDGTAAPIVYSSANQVTAILPYSLTGRASANLVVEFGGERSDSISLAIAETAPGLFTADGTQGAILNQDNTPNRPGNGAEPGAIISLFGTGEGQTAPAGTDGLIITADRLPVPNAQVAVEIQGRPAEVLYAGGAPGSPAGAFQMNVRVPVETTRGAQVPVIVRIGSRSSQTGVVLTTR